MDLSKITWLNRPKGRFVLLAAGALLLFLTRERWAVHLLGWIAPVPFLIYLRTGKGWRNGLLFLGIYCIGSVLGAAKSFTPPWPRFMALAFGLPLGLVHGSGYLIWNRLRQNIPSWLENVVFAAVMVVMEWAVYMWTPFGTVGAAAHTQLDNLPLLQTTSLFGIGGLSFLLYWFASITAGGVCEKRLPQRQTFLVLGIVMAAHIFGAYRMGSSKPSPTATVAAVQTDFDWFATPVIPPRTQRRDVTDTLFERSVAAADKGAKMVVWNEIANMVDPPDEPALIKRAQTVAENQNIHLVLSYLKLLSAAPIRWENKYVWIDPKGGIVDTYLKHKPAKPVEPAVEGSGTPKIVDTGFGKAAGAICFDFDFPQIGRALAKGGIDFAFVPSADSPSIDPYHTQVAAIRAIEGGYSVIRSVRHGTSAGFDPYGRAHGWLSSNSSDEKILLVTIPTKAVWTLYKTVGDIVPWFSLLFLVFLTGRHVFSWIRPGKQR